MHNNVLLVDDNAALILSLKQALREQYHIEVARTGAQAIQKINQYQYHCVVLDLGLPDMTGLEVCTKIRQSGNSTPIIILSGDHAVTQKVELLDNGADDYVTKPVNLQELKARLRTAIRRMRLPQSLGSKLKLKDVTLDSLQHTVMRDGKPISLRPKEFALLECLMNNAGRVVSRPVLMQYAWDDGADVWTNVVDVHIKHLRDKIDYPFDTPLIKTVHGLGYKFDASSVANIMKGGKASERAITNRTH